jgi:hypothetical protein
MALMIYSSVSIGYTIALAQNQTNSTRTDDYANTMNSIFSQILNFAIAIGAFIYTKFIAGKKDEENYAWVKSGLGFLNLLKDKEQTIHESNKMTFKLFETVDPRIFDKLTEVYPLAKLDVTKAKVFAITEKIQALTAVLSGSDGKKLSTSQTKQIKDEIAALVKQEQEINADQGVRSSNTDGVAPIP